MVEKRFDDSYKEQLITRNEFERVVDLVVAIIETQFISNMIDIQDEVDKYSTSLWALSEKTLTDKLLSGNRENLNEPMLKLDEDCISCTLDKYRPHIKEAFKMACI